MKSLKGTQTEKNILTAFSGESQARNRYTYFASQAKKEGFVQISHIFEETADQEKEHAKRLFKLLEGGEVEITASFPAGVIETIQLMRSHGVRRVPVVDAGGALVGILAADDLLDLLAEELSALARIAPRGQEREVRSRLP